MLTLFTAMFFGGVVFIILLFTVSLYGYFSKRKDIDKAEARNMCIMYAVFISLILLWVITP